MAVNTNDYSSPLSQDTSRGPSQSIWSQFQVGDAQQDRGGGTGGPGVEIWDDFCPLPSPTTQGGALGGIGGLGQWASWLDTSQTVLDGNEEGGVAKLTGAATANKTSFFSSNAGMFRFFGASTAYTQNPAKFGMECRVAFSSVASADCGFFFGLADSTSSQINSSATTILAASGNTLTTTKNLFGFFKRATTNYSDFSFVYQPAGGTAVYPTGLTTLVNTVTGSNLAAYAASTDVGKGTGFVKIGMVYDPTSANPAVVTPASPPANMTAGNLRRPTLRFYVNGQLHGQFISFADINPGSSSNAFPGTASYCPCFGYSNQNASTAHIVYLDWVRYYQQASF